jgi:hypothetical protein
VRANVALVPTLLEMDGLDIGARTGLRVRTNTDGQSGRYRVNGWFDRA